MASKLVKFLSKTHEGKKHDKTICEEEKYELPDESVLIGDLAFQGYKPKGAEVVIPFKKPRGGELSEGEKEANKLISSFRVRVEHVISGIKRLRIVKDTIRNLRDGFSDKVLEIACGLHNLRTSFRTGLVRHTPVEILTFESL
jgi:hypothetical protein